MADNIEIFKSRNGEVGRHEADFYTTGAGHLLCCDMAREIEGLRTTAKSQARKLAAIFSLCQRHSSPAVNVGAHALASEVLAIIERGSE